jgi:hypothetical protein
LRGSPCVGCARPCCRVTFGPFLLPLRAAPLAANLARVPLLHHYVEACELVGQRHGHVPKAGLLWRVGKAGRLATGGLSGLPAVPPNDVRRGDLECHACFTKLVFELVEVRVRGTALKELDFTINNWSSGSSSSFCGSMLGPASSGGVNVDASGCFPSGTATATKLGSGGGRGGGGAGWARLEPPPGQGSYRRGRGAQQNQGLSDLVL